MSGSALVDCEIVCTYVTLKAAITTAAGHVRLRHRLCTQQNHRLQWRSTWRKRVGKTIGNALGKAKNVTACVINVEVSLRFHISSSQLNWQKPSERQITKWTSENAWWTAKATIRTVYAKHSRMIISWINMKANNNRLTVTVHHLRRLLVYGVKWRRRAHLLHSHHPTRLHRVHKYELHRRNISTQSSFTLFLFLHYLSLPSALKFYNKLFYSGHCGV